MSASKANNSHPYIPENQNVRRSHPSMSSFPINLPTLKGSVLWKAMLRRCSTDLNNGVALVRAKRDGCAGKQFTFNLKNKNTQI